MNRSSLQAFADILLKRKRLGLLATLACFAIFALDLGLCLGLSSRESMLVCIILGSLVAILALGFSLFTFAVCYRPSAYMLEATKRAKNNVGDLLEGEIEEGSIIEKVHEGFPCVEFSINGCFGKRRAYYPMGLHEGLPQGKARFVLVGTFLKGYEEIS